MKINLLAFGLAKDIIGQQKVVLEVMNGLTTDGFSAYLYSLYPSLYASPHIRLAVNESYVQEPIVLNEGDEVALIPPVSGG